MIYINNDNRTKCIIGENAAAEYYVSLGYEIIERNWRFGHIGELDVIVFDKNSDLLIICEVKARSKSRYFRPSDSVDRKKKNKILKLANAFLYKNRKYLNCNVRFDVIEVVIDGNILNLNCIENAF